MKRLRRVPRDPYGRRCHAVYARCRGCGVWTTVYVQKIDRIAYVGCPDCARWRKAG